MQKISIFMSLFLLFIAGSLYPQAELDPHVMWRLATGGKITALAESPLYEWSYALSEDKSVYAFKNDGTLLWQSEYFSYRPSSSMVSGVDGTLYIPTRFNELYALNPAGRVIWKVGLSGTISGDPVPGDDGLLYYLTDSGVMAGRNHLGRLLWQRQLDFSPASKLYYDSYGSLWLLDGRGVMLRYDTDGRRRAEFEALGSAGGEISGRARIRAGRDRVYVAQADTIRAFGLEGSLLWDFRIDDTWSDFLRSGSELFVLSRKGTLYAIEESAGKLKWKKSVLPAGGFIKLSHLAGGTIFLTGGSTTKILKKNDGQKIHELPTTHPGTNPLISADGAFIIGGRDWVLYRYLLVGELEDEAAMSVLSHKSPREPIEGPGPKELYTRQLLDLSARRPFEKLLPTLRKDLESDDPERRYHQTIKTLEILAGVGVLNPLKRDGIVINDFPDIRREAVALLAEFGNIESQDFLLKLLQYEWDPAVILATLRALGSLKSDAEGNVVKNLRFMVQSNALNYEDDPSLAVELITAVDNICRYSGVVRPEAAKLLTHIYFSSLPRQIRLEAISTLRGFKEKK